jgi:hypothetical protein
MTHIRRCTSTSMRSAGTWSGGQTGRQERTWRLDGAIVQVDLGAGHRTRMAAWQGARDGECGWTRQGLNLLGCCGGGGYWAQELLWPCVDFYFGLDACATLINGLTWGYGMKCMIRWFGSPVSATCKPKSNVEYRCTENENRYRTEKPKNRKFGSVFGGRYKNAQPYPQVLLGTPLGP